MINVILTIGLSSMGVRNLILISDPQRTPILLQSAKGVSLIYCLPRLPSSLTDSPLILDENLGAPPSPPPARLSLRLGGCILPPKVASSRLKLGARLPRPAWRRIRS